MKLCSVDGCQEQSKAKGYCGKHYQRLWRGAPTPSGKYKQDPSVRFWQQVQVAGPGECWLWMGNATDRYGTLYRHPALGGRIGAHRFSYELHNGAIPAGMLVMHTCDTPKCVNPAHLKAGSPKENMADMDAKGRRVVAYPKGEQSNLSRLNEHAVRFIRCSDQSNSALGRIFGLTPNAIRAVRIRKSWAHIP